MKTLEEEIFEDFLSLMDYQEIGNLFNIQTNQYDKSLEIPKDIEGFILSNFLKLNIKLQKKILMVYPCIYLKINKICKITCDNINQSFLKEIVDSSLRLLLVLPEPNQEIISYIEQKTQINHIVAWKAGSIMHSPFLTKKVILHSVMKTKTCADGSEIKLYQRAIENILTRSDIDLIFLHQLIDICPDYCRDIIKAHPLYVGNASMILDSLDKA